MCPLDERSLEFKTSPKTTGGVAVIVNPSESPGYPLSFTPGITILD